MQAMFYLSAAVAILATLLMVTELHAIHALLYLVVSLLAVAVVFLALGAPFVAALEVIVYAGAIVVLFIFVVMMLNVGEAAVEQERRWLTPLMWVGPTVLLLILLAEVGYMLTVGGSPSVASAVVGGDGCRGGRRRARSGRHCCASSSWFSGAITLSPCRN